MNKYKQLYGEDVVNEAFPRVCPPSNKYQDKGVTYPSYTQPAKDKNNESWISNVDSSLSTISDFSVVLSGGCGLLAALSIQSGLVYLPQGAAITGILITCAWLFGAIGIVSGGTEVVSGIAGHGIDGRELSASESNYRVEHGTGTVIKSSVNVMTAAVVSVSYKQSLPDKGAGGAGVSYDSFNAFKKANPVKTQGNQWHHVVEQNQVNKSGFSVQKINNTNNLIELTPSQHSQITGYYNTKSFQFTNGLSVRDWLAGQSFEMQYKFGVDKLKGFGVIK